LALPSRWEASQSIKHQKKRGSRIESTDPSEFLDPSALPVKDFHRRSFYCKAAMLLENARKFSVSPWESFTRAGLRVWVARFTRIHTRQ